MKRAVCTTLLCLSLTSSFAALIDLDYAGSGDGDITRDTVTGLDWLDLDRNFGLAPSAALAATGGSFRYATIPELKNFFANLGFPPLEYLPGSGFSSDAAVQASAIQAVLTRLGMSDGRPGFNCLTGYVQSQSLAFDLFDSCPVGGISNIWALIASGVGADIGLTGATSNEPNPNIGTFLVRDAANVPEPGTTWLAVCALAILGMRRTTQLIRPNSLHV